MSGQAGYLFSARHVFFDNSGRRKHDIGTLLAYSDREEDSQRYELQLNLDRLHADGNIKSHPIEDAVVIRLFTVRASESADAFAYDALPGCTVLRRGEGMAMFVHPDLILTAENVWVGNQCFVLGYPTSIGLPEIPQIEMMRPLVRRGAVAGTNRTLRTIILDAQVFPGNSGGPVFQLSRTFGGAHIRMIGIVSQFIPLRRGLLLGVSSVANSGYSVAVSMNPLIALVNDFEM
jgi:hypothetical protein